MGTARDAADCGEFRLHAHGRGDGTRPCAARPGRGSRGRRRAASTSPSAARAATAVAGCDVAIDFTAATAHQREPGGLPGASLRARARNDGPDRRAPPTARPRRPRDSRRLRPQHERRRPGLHGAGPACGAACWVRKPTSRSAKPTIATRWMRRPALRCSWARPSRPSLASRLDDVAVFDRFAVASAAPAGFHRLFLRACRQRRRGPRRAVRARRGSHPPAASGAGSYDVRPRSAAGGALGRGPAAGPLRDGGRARPGPQAG